MPAILTIGIDLAKNVFAIHGVDATGKPALVRPSVARAKLIELIAALPPCAGRAKQVPSQAAWLAPLQWRAQPCVRSSRPLLQPCPDLLHAIDAVVSGQCPAL